MSGPRHRVRATPDFFYQIDQELPAERDDSGRPTRAEFEAYELMKVIDRFETGWDDLAPLFLGRSEYRILIARGSLVPVYSITGQLAPDGAVELIVIEFVIEFDVEADW